MSVSRADQVALTCSQCGSEFTAQVWLIVDGAAQPDLLARARDGTLDDAPCPQCGHVNQADAPLLLFRPGAEPPILFSPAQQTDRAQDEEHARELVAQLRHGLGDAWQDAWLAEGLPGVERAMLPVALSDDPEGALREMQAQAAAALEEMRQNDPEAFAQMEAEMRRALAQQPLLQALDQFIRAESWLASRRVVQEHAALLEPEADTLLAQLIAQAQSQGDANGERVLSEHRELLRACREEGVDAAFAAKMGLSSASDLDAAAAAAELPPAVREILTELAAEGITLNTPEDLQRLLAARPELQERLARAAGSALPPGLEPLLRALSQPPRSVLDMPRRIELCRRALALLPRAINPQLWAALQTELGNSLAQTPRGERAENLEQAIAAYQQALEVYTPIAFPDDCYRLARHLGGIQAKQERWQAAATTYHLALEADEVLFQAALLQEGKQRQLARTADLYHRAAFALARSGDAAAAAETAERSRARLLRERLERNRRDLQRLPELGHSDLYERYQAAVRRRQDLSAQALAVAERPADDAARIQRTTYRQLEQVQAEIHVLIEEIQQIPGYANFMRSLNAEQIQALAAETPLSYLLTGETGSVALVVTADAVEAIWTDLDSAALSGLMVEHDGETVTGGYLPGQLFGSQTSWLEDSLVDLLPQLGEQLLEPLARYLHSHDLSGVVLIPTGQLGLLPLHAARYARDGRARYLLDEFDVTYAPSAQALAATRRWLARHAERAPLLAGVGNPLPHPRPLDFAHAELEDIAALFGGRARPLFGRDATKTALLAQVADASHVHLACHGLFDLENPLATQLQLAHGDALTLEEILDEAPFAAARLVVLSACQTAITEFRSLPDEVIGLPAGVLQAGVPGVVGTLWPVNDLSTALLMTKFYEYHLQGDPATGDGPLPPVRALGRAQRWLRRVTAEELTAYFESHKALHDTQRRAMRSRMPEGVAAEGVMRFGFVDGKERPFADEPYHWAAFIFMGA